jgi:tripartite-type tricarboxylate transporter receptor subunit TctC
MTIRRFCALLASAPLFGAIGNTYAAETAYPTKPIRLIIPFPPGGSADPLGRAFGAWFSEKLGVPVVADNRPGAGTAIAHTMGARAAPDGYTLLLSSSSGMAANPAFGAKLDYHPVNDFVHIGLGSYVPQLIAIHPAVPAKTMRELIDLAKAQPEKVRAGSPGMGTLGHLSVAYLNSLTGARFLHVPYKGTGPAMTDLLANRIQTSMSSVTGSLPHVQSGRLRAVAVGHSKRINQFPDVPTVAETLPGFANDGWYGLVAPLGTSPVIVARLNTEMNRALSQPEFQKQIDATGMVQGGGTPADLRDFVRNELARWTKVVRDAGLSAQE